MSKAVVSIVKGDSPINEEKIKTMVNQAIDLIGGISKIVKPGSSVVIKPNWLAPLPSPVTTNPLVVKALIQLCKNAGAKQVVVAEYAVPHGRIAPHIFGNWKTLKDLCPKMGWDKTVEEVGGELLALEDEELKEVKVKGGLLLRKVKVPKIIIDCDVLIDVPVMKTHFYTLVTLGIKNMIGILPDEWKLFAHKEDIDQFLVDIVKIRKPDLTIIDAIRTLQGYDHHVIQDDIVEMNLVIAGEDVVATDTVGASVMGFDPYEEITHIRLAHNAGIGTANLDEIEVNGEKIEKVKKIFKRPDQRLFGIYPNIDIYSGGACNYCIVRLKVALERLKVEGRLSEEKFSIIMGHRPILPEPDEIVGKVLVMGDCGIFALAERMKLALRERLFLITGCPPMWTVDMVTLDLFPPRTN